MPPLSVWTLLVRKVDVYCELRKRLRAQGQPGRWCTFDPHFSIERQEGSNQSAQAAGKQQEQHAIERRMAGLRGKLELTLSLVKLHADMQLPMKNSG